MILADVAAALAGLMVGVLALVIFWHFLRELDRGIFRPAVPGYILGLLFGTFIASAPIGHLLVGQPLWGWYLVGEAVVFAPGAILGAYWNIVRVVRTLGKNGRRI